MRYLFTLLFAALSLNVIGQTNQNYNPDYDDDGAISVNDLLGFLSIFGDTWDSGDVIMGCTYPGTLEYNPLANMDDGSCSMYGCDGIINSGSVNDECGVCGGNNSTCADCCLVPNGDGTSCDGVCGACNDNTSCLDECGVPNGDNACLDECGVPNGDGSSCAVFESCGDLVAHEGYEYSTVQIGEQCWFSENCRYLPVVSPPSQGDQSDPYYYVYGYSCGDCADAGADVITAQATSNYETYGVLYNWPAVMTEGVCPSGWHIPSDGEYTQLTDFLGNEASAMKSASGWGNDGNGSNSSGFNALPGGTVTFAGNFSNLDDYTYFWSSSAQSNSNPLCLELTSFSSGSYQWPYNPKYGMSARCVVDYTDECGVLNGDNSSCADACGVTNGDNSTCSDECGVPNGDNSTCSDECGVLNGDGSSCAVFESCGDLVAHEGYEYSTVQIGEQCWFSENCRYLPAVSPPDQGNATAPYFYVYGYEGVDVVEAKSTVNYEMYGVLYNWPAVMTEGVCPNGWHVPSDGEFTQLTDYLGGESVAGGKMKDDVQWNGSNSSGFTALPGGARLGGGFYHNGFKSWWWTSSEYSWYSWKRELQHNLANVFRGYDERDPGYAARCVIDWTDECGILNGNNSTCSDECGVPNGDNSTCSDECGVPNGDNSTCSDECGVLYGDGSSCAVFESCGDLVAHEGYEYSTVQIGEQCWFSENCRYLPAVSPPDVESTTSPYYYVYDYDGSTLEEAKATENYETYGVLYNWPAVMTEGVCPNGWHVPSNGEFTQLTDYLGGEGIAGGPMKEAGFDHWQSPNVGATNSSGFTGLAGGYRWNNAFNYSYFYGYWWSSDSWSHTLFAYDDDCINDSSNPEAGYSARCVQD